MEKVCPNGGRAADVAVLTNDRHIKCLCRSLFSRDGEFILSRVSDSGVCDGERSGLLILQQSATESSLIGDNN